MNYIPEDYNRDIERENEILRTQLQEKETELNEKILAEEARKKHSWWRVLLAVLFLYAATTIIVVLGSMLFGFIASELGVLHNSSKFLFWVIIIIGGTFLFGLLILPFTLGLPVLFETCEKISPSKTGLRYKIFFSFEILLQIVNMITGFEWIQIYIAIFSLVGLIMAINMNK